MIRLEHIRKVFDDKIIFSDFSLELPEKGIVCFLAPSGFGKTTLFRLILGLEKPDAGAVLGTEGLKFSCAFQEPRLVPGLTALQNVLLVSVDRSRRGREAEDPKKKDAEALLQKLGLDDEMENLPAELSGGEARRVSLARALYAEYDVLILDEPFSGVDEERKAQIYPLISALAEEKLVLMTTHLPEEAEILGADMINLSRK